MTAPQQRNQVSGTFTDERDAAEALKVVRREHGDKVHVNFDDIDDVSAGRARSEEASQAVAGPGYAMTTKQAAGGASGLVVGVVVASVLGAVVSIPLAMSAAISWALVPIVIACAAFAGGTVGVLFGGRAGGIGEMMQEEQNHERRVVIKIDADDDAEADRARAELRAAGADSRESEDGQVQPPRETL